VKGLPHRLGHIRESSQRKRLHTEMSVVFLVDVCVAYSELSVSYILQSSLAIRTDCFKIFYS